MAKVTNEQRVKYQEHIAFYKKKLEELEKEIKTLKLQIVKEPAEVASYAQIKIAKLLLQEIGIYCAMNEVSVDFLEVKNTLFLDKARQFISDVIINLSKIVTNYLDVPFSDYEKELALLSEMSDDDKYKLICQIGYCTDIIKNNFGENSKWRWAFLDTDSKFAILAKNMFDLRRYQKLDNPMEDGYQVRRAHIALIQKMLTQVSLRYREKYELSGKDPEDLKRAIDFQCALHRIVSVLGDPEKVETSKKQIDVWKILLDKHFADEDAKKKHLQR